MHQPLRREAWAARHVSKQKYVRIEMRIEEAIQIHTKKIDTYYITIHITSLETTLPRKSGTLYRFWLQEQFFFMFLIHTLVCLPARLLSVDRSRRHECLTSDLGPRAFCAAGSRGGAPAPQESPPGFVRNPLPGADGVGNAGGRYSLWRRRVGTAEAMTRDKKSPCIGRVSVPAIHGAMYLHVFACICMYSHVFACKGPAQVVWIRNCRTSFLSV